MKGIFSYLFFTLFATATFAQQKVEILNADELVHVVDAQGPYRKLLGNVRLKQDELLMSCDSAYHFYEANKINAFGNVHIQQNDSLDIRADYLDYDGISKEAKLKRNVVLSDKGMTLRTQELFYSLKEDKASYYSGADIKMQETDLRSNIGHYWSKTQLAFFIDSVRLTNPDYQLEADSLRYSVGSNITYFSGPTVITTKENTVYCEGGWYNEPNASSLFTDNAIMHSPPSRISADSLFYDQGKGYGTALHNVEWFDSIERIMINGEYAEFMEESYYIKTTDQAYLTVITDEDSLYLRADTLFSYLDSSQFRIFKAYHRVLIYKPDMQGRCDSIYYSYQDSLFRMFVDPILWSNESQMTADTITLQMAKNQPKQVNMYNNAFMINYSDSLLYDQVKGKNTFGYFKNGEMNKMLVQGNGQSIYYGKDESEAYIGVNKIECSNMWIFFAEQTINRINFLNKPDAKFDPIQKIDPSNFLLKGFKWHGEGRPRSKEDIVGE